MHRPRALAPLAALLLAAAALNAQGDRPRSVPVEATATVDATALASTGRALLRLRFVCREPLDRPYSLRVELRRGDRTILRRDHAPPVATKLWAKDRPVDYALPLVFRTPPAGVRPGDTIEVCLGFFDAQDNAVVAPRARFVPADGLVRVATFLFPDLAADADAAAVDAVIAAAMAIAGKEPQEAWDQLESVFRRIDDYPLKRKLQQALSVVGRSPPAPLSFEEQDIVQGRIRAERARYLREVAGYMHDRGKRLGAILLLDEVGGSLKENADRAVLGALSEAKRVTKDRDAIAAEVFALGKEQEAEVAALVDSHRNDKERLAAAVRLAKDPLRRAVARALVQTLEGYPQMREAAAAARAAIEKEWLADVPADERAEAEAAMQHPCWVRTATRPSHRFVMIGPKQLVEDIPGDSLLRFDLAYLYLTDLFGRVPNPDGDRVTVYWKELWDFGGGVGGGKTIDIGKANPEAKDTRVDHALLYHELTHCVDDTSPVYGGMHEGIADVGAAFSMMELEQAAGGRAAIAGAARAFQQDYLERDLEYWRIPNYGPSAGFFLHFITSYGKSGDGYRWQLYRQFFRDYRACPVKDARTPTLARAFAFHLTEAFGEAAFADLMRFRWPLLPTDLVAVRLEQKAARKRGLGPTLDAAPGSPVPRDRLASRLDAEQAGVDDHAQELAVVKDWWVIGPFRREGIDPDAYRFPPELEIDLQAQYESVNNNPIWRRPGARPVTVAPTGWLQLDFQYMDDSATYALTHVTVDRDTEAWFHLRCDDDVTLFVNDELVGKHGIGRGALGPWRPDWTVQLPDAIRFAVNLKQGRNKVLVKVRNTVGPSGLILAIARRNGLPLSGSTTDVEPPARKLAAVDAPDAGKWPSRFRASFDARGSHRKLDTEVGQWRVRNGALEGFATDRQVEWRKYTVRPGFPKDSPSNLAWLPEKATEQLDAFHLTVDLAAASPSPKLCLILQGDGRRDALCGWTLILEPHGDKVRAHLERYDERIYMSDWLPFPKDSKKPTRLDLSYFAKRLTVRLGPHLVLDQAPLLPIPGRHRIGLATWGEATRIEAVELRGPPYTRPR
jgi:hypothetical protein